MSVRDKIGLSTQTLFEGLIGTIPLKEYGEKASIYVEDRCPVCGSERYLHPKLKLLASPCCHRICDNCVHRIYAHGSAPCPICKQQLKKSQWQEQSFNDLLVERECRIRKQLGRIYNKRFDDFDSLERYNNYLEEIEEIVFNLVHTIDIEETQLLIDKHRQENSESIQKNITRQLQEDRYIQQQLENEKKAASLSLLHRKLIIEDEKIETHHASMVINENEHIESIKNSNINSSISSPSINKEASIESKRPNIVDKFQYSSHYGKQNYEDKLSESINRQALLDRSHLFKTAFGGEHPDVQIDNHIQILDTYVFDPYSVENQFISKTSEFYLNDIHLRALESSFSFLFISPIN